MKNLKKMLRVLFVVLLVLSCKKSFLDAPNTDSAFKQVYVTDLKTTADYLKGTYLVLSSDFFARYQLIYPEVVADNIKLVDATSSYLSRSYNWAQSASSVETQDIWMFGYKVIRHCNFVLEKAEAYKVDNPELSNEIKAQAYGLRALCYSILVNVYAQPYGFTSGASHPGVPYITSSDWTDPVSGRQTVAEVYNNMISDLKNAIPLFANNSISTLYMNQKAAKALLARIYLYKGDYPAAKNIAREIIASTPLMSGPNYPGKLFTLQETEALFQLPPGFAGLPSSSYYLDINIFNSAIYFDMPFLQFLPTNDVVSLLNDDPHDVRNNWVTKQSDGSWIITKYPKDVVPGFPTYFSTGSYYPTLLRSSEMYLIAAEAHANLNNVDSAHFYLDALRKRANPAAASSIEIGTALLEAIYKERRKELAFEGLRMFDLQRWKKGVHRIDGWNANAKDLPYPSNKAIAPIPNEDVFKLGLPQNAEY